MVGIAAFGAYVPAYRLDRTEIKKSLGSGFGRGSRAVASHDEDTTTLAVAAVRNCLSGLDAETAPVRSLWFATSRPAYLEKSNATTVSVASGLPAETGAFDVSGALRGGAGALRAGLAEGASIAVAADIRFGLPGSADETEGTDAAAAFVLSDDPVAELLATVSESSELLDRWREPGEVRTRSWEERFGAEEYIPLAVRVIDDVLGRCELKREDVDHVVVSGPHARAVKSIRAGFGAEQLAGAERAVLGFAGTADFGLRLVSALETATPGQIVLAVSVVDGADAFVFRVTEKMRDRAATSIVDSMGDGLNVRYADYLTWRGLLPREPARRPEIKPPAPPASRRTYGWKFGFLAAECLECGYRNMPPRRVCLSCSATDRTESVSMLDVPARVVTFGDDMLSESVQLPAKVVAVDFDGGGRFEFEMTDAVGHQITVGDRVDPTFRVASVAANQVRNYVWKVRPHQGEGA